MSLCGVVTARLNWYTSWLMSLCGVVTARLNSLPVWQHTSGLNLFLARLYPWLARKSRPCNHLFYFASQKPQMAIFCCIMTLAAREVCTSAPYNSGVFVSSRFTSGDLINVKGVCKCRQPLQRVTLLHYRISKLWIHEILRCAHSRLNAWRLFTRLQHHCVSTLYPVYVQLKRGRQAYIVADDGVRQCNQHTNLTVPDLEKLIFVCRIQALPAFIKGEDPFPCSKQTPAEPPLSAINFKPYFSKTSSLAHSVPERVLRFFTVYTVCVFISYTTDTCCVNPLQWFDHRHNIRWSVQIWRSSDHHSCMILSTLLYRPLSPSLSVRTKYSPRRSATEVRRSTRRRLTYSAT
jgi:hypothetical protein